MKRPQRPLSRRNVLKHLGAAGALGALSPLGLHRAWGADRPTIGVIYVGPRDDFGYNQSHAQAAAELKKMGFEVVEEERVPETVAVQKTMEGMIRQDGAKLLFPTSYGYFDPHVLAMAKKYPDIRFAHCGGLWTPKDPTNVGSFFGYIFEAEYLSGIAAGYATKSKKLGFIAAKPIPQVLQNINAFTLGAQSVHPDITTTVIFTGDWSLPVKEAEATNSLIDQGVDVLTMHVDSPKVVVETAERRKVFVTGYHANQSSLAPRGYLTGAEWNWIVPYKKFVDAVVSGGAYPNFVRGGLKENFVKTSAFGPGVKPEAANKINAIKAQMLKGGFSVFKGPLKDNKGNTVIPAGTAYPETARELEGMNYLVAGVIGQA